jgi:3-oxoacyl-[acyl-carrier protein] reductase
MIDLSGRVAIVTGASRGIGRAIATRLAAQGAKVVAAARGDNAREAAAAIVAAGGAAEPLTLDVTESDGIDAAVSGVLERHGRVDILVNNAGITRDQLMLRLKRGDWDAVLATNLTSAFTLTQAVLKPMIRQRAGRIICISSVVGQSGNAGQANYAASKAGLIGFAKSVALEVASRNITVNDRRQGPRGMGVEDSAETSGYARRCGGSRVFSRLGRGVVYYGAGTRRQRRHVSLIGWRAEWPSRTK